MKESLKKKKKVTSDYANFTCKVFIWIPWRKWVYFYYNYKLIYHITGDIKIIEGNLILFLTSHFPVQQIHFHHTAGLADSVNACGTTELLHHQWLGLGGWVLKQMIPLGLKGVYAQTDAGLVVSCSIEVNWKQMSGNIWTLPTPLS